VQGRDHALTGAVAFAAAAPLLHLTALSVAAGTVLTAGAALLPDIDEPGSTISRQGGFLTMSLAWIVSPLLLAALAFLLWRDASGALTAARIR
jgi:LexA-binding, inner membrane-associated putative hydrolase